MTEQQFMDDFLKQATAYGSSEKTVIVRCTCPTPENCACVPDAEEYCPACATMEHTEADCMIHVLQNFKPGTLQTAEQELGMAVKSYCSEHGIGGEA